MEEQGLRSPDVECATGSPGKMKRRRQEEGRDGENSLLQAFERVLYRRRTQSDLSNNVRPPPLSEGHATGAPFQEAENDTLKQRKAPGHGVAHRSDASSSARHEIASSGLLGSILYDLSRELQSKTSVYDAFQLLYGAVRHVENKEQSINLVKSRRLQRILPRNLPQQLMARRMGRHLVEPKIISRQVHRIAKKLKRAVNVWGHHCCMDEIDDNKPYNEPPQVKCIRFDRTGEVIITGGDEGIIKLWHTFNCTLITSLRKHAGGIMCIDVHPNNFFILSCCDGGELWLWEINGNLYRPHRRICIQFKYLWCRFLCGGGERAPGGPRGRCEAEINSTLIVCVSANSQLTIYRMADMMASSGSGNITDDVVPLYTVELFNHNIKAYDISRSVLHDNSSLIALGIEPMFLEESRMNDDIASLVMSVLQREQMAAAKKCIPGKYGKIITSALCVLFNVSTGEIVRPQMSDENGGCPNGENTTSSHKVRLLPTSEELCVCDTDGTVTKDATGNCMSCAKGTGNITLPPFKGSCLGVLSKGKLPEEEDAENALNIPEAPENNGVTFLWKTKGNFLEDYAYKALASYDLGDDIRAIDPSEVQPTGMQIGRIACSVLFPSYMDNPWLAHEANEYENRSPGNFDDLLYHVQPGHETSPDVCFSNHSLDHVTASDDGKMFLWTQCSGNMKFKRTNLYTKCLSRWLNKPETLSEIKKSVPVLIDPAYLVKTRKADSDGTSTISACEYSLSSENGDENVYSMDLDYVEPKSEPITELASPELDMDTMKRVDTTDTSTNAETPVVEEVPSEESNKHLQYMHRPKSHINVLMEPDSFVTEEPVDNSVAYTTVKKEEPKDTELFKEDEVEKQTRQETGHHYVITDIAWSKSDKYIFIADSLVTRYNVKKLITAARTITSGVSVFNNEGQRVADFLHSDISHHVGCVKPHPISDDVALSITYGGAIYIFSVGTQTILRKFDCGPNAIWLDADWHPEGLYFVACQLFGCFSLFAVEELKKHYSYTLNHQCGYSDLLSLNTSTFYTASEGTSTDVRRYYHGSMLLPPLELQGSQFDESLNMHTINTVNTILDENRCEVLVVANRVPMHIQDTSLWSNRLFGHMDLPMELARTIKVLNRMHLIVGIIEYIQWHSSTYDRVDVGTLVQWFLVVNKLENLISHPNKQPAAECPYGGTSCSLCVYISGIKQTSKRYNNISSGFRGMMSLVNDRGDIISCLPIAARPQGPSQNVVPLALERRAYPSPTTRVVSSHSSRATHSARSHNTRSAGLSRSQTQPRPQATRIQPPRQSSLAQRAATSDASTADYHTPRTPTRSMSSSTRGRMHRESSSDETPDRDMQSAESLLETEQDVMHEGTELLSGGTQMRSSMTQELANNLEQSSTSRMIMPDPAEEMDVEDETFTPTSRKSENFKNEVERMRNASFELDPLVLSTQLRREPNILDVPCAICGFVTETSKPQRGPSKKVLIGGSRLLSNALVGPFEPPKRLMRLLRREMRGACDRLNDSLFMHIGCIAAATFLVVDSSAKSILNFPEIIFRGMHSSCSYCKGDFATLHCKASECGRVFHYPCAVLSFEDDLYKKRQTTIKLNPSFHSRMENYHDPLLSDNFLCVDCTLKSWIDGSCISMEPLCSGDYFLESEARSWLYGDSRECCPATYVPQGGDLLVVPPHVDTTFKANIAAGWKYKPNYPLMEIKQLDYRFYGPLSGKFGVCTVMSMRQIDGKKLQSLFYYPDGLEVHPFIDVMVGLWRMTKLNTGDIIKVRGPNGLQDAVVKSVKKPYVCGSDLGIILGDYSVTNAALIAQAAVYMGSGCIEIEPSDEIGQKQFFSAWEVTTNDPDESTLLEKISDASFPPLAKEQLINLTLDPALEPFNTIQSPAETTEVWVKTYWRVIPCPMYLEKIRQRILGSYYTRPQGAFADLELIIQNCRAFNHPSSSICRDLGKLEQSMADVKEEIRRMLSTDKHIKMVMEHIWPAVEQLFTNPIAKGKQGKSVGRRVLTEEASLGLSQSSENEIRETKGIRRSSRLSKAHKVEETPTSSIQSKKYGERTRSTRNAKDEVSRSRPSIVMPDPDFSTTSLSTSRLSQSRVIYDEGEEGDSSSYAPFGDTKMQMVEDSATTVPVVDSYSALNEQKDAHSKDKPPQKRRSSRVAELKKKTYEEMKQRERERMERERQERERRYRNVEYNLRKK
ncbi:hypothetical protein BgAZ_402290 [Babesia gibsoni]|uniref:Bromo domain-containing protein n=1 Tax=Babesia gibsoni TaxID=33632 RepID=A0AAD8LHC0_BABGI|nr:hypothetical protein BgAZ_402290 [Babesia gibsoni]